MDKEILEAALNALAINSTKSHEKTSNKTGLPRNWVSALFKRFQSRYPHKWTSAIDGIEEVAVSEWSEGLAGLTGEQIKHGLNTWASDWPPSLPEFRNACISNTSKAALHKTYLKIAAPRPSAEIVRQQIAAMRKLTK